MYGIPFRYLTDDLPGIGGRIKADIEDFRVEEVPLYPACGEGEHVYFEIEKRDLSTPEVLRRLARELSRSISGFGWAGMKDRKAIARQTLSVSGVDPERILAVDLPGLRILWVRRHTNKLRLGHLKGNRFEVWVRDLDAPDPARVEAILDRLRDRGAPNYFGPQRFGARGDAQWVGRAFLVHDDRAAIHRILGHPAPSEHNPDVVRARYLFMQYRWADAARAFPPYYRVEHRLLRYLRRCGENYAGARKQVPAADLKLYFTAYQSHLFNACLHARMEACGGDLERFTAGDIAFLHRGGALFRVEDPAALAERARALEISPSGPMFGKQMLVPAPGLQADIESRRLEIDGLRLADFHQLEPHHHLGGGRRPLRVPVEDLEWRIENGHLWLRFFLPRGSFATSLLRELTKNELPLPGLLEQGLEQATSPRLPSAACGSSPSEEGTAGPAHPGAAGDGPPAPGGPPGREPAG
ncbi:MAG: tRNA pseudouridine(13) synthase TruD [Planctomycetes bacterium]|nr:tRNA pseudouridine(13) synthase TruD [Planctomycetota bacterium]